MITLHKLVKSKVDIFIKVGSNDSKHSTLYVKFAWDYLQMQNLKVVVQASRLYYNIMKNVTNYLVMVQDLFLVVNGFISP